MRRKQLKIISYSYLAANMLVIVELVILFGLSNRHVVNCARLCANPNTNAAAFFLLALAFCHLLPTHLFLISFVIIPRRFNTTGDEEIQLTSDDIASNQQPLLEQNLNLVEDDMTWQRDSLYKDRDV